MKATDVITSEQVSRQALYPGVIVKIASVEIAPGRTDREAYRRILTVEGNTAHMRPVRTYEWWIYRGIRWLLKQIRRRFPEYDPQSAFEYLLLPWSAARWTFAWCWSLVYYPLCKLQWWIRANMPRLFLLTRYILPFGGGRWEDVTPVHCPHCLWCGPTRWLVHTYGGYADEFEDNIEGVEECPRCGSEV